jgi:hypothetical protein
LAKASWAVLFVVSGGLVASAIADDWNAPGTYNAGAPSLKEEIAYG